MTDPPKPAAVRDSAWVQREYGEEKWPETLGWIRAELAAGETSLPRLWATIQRAQWTKDDRYRYTELEPLPITCFGQPVAAPAAVVWAGITTLVSDLVIANCRPDTDTIVELGSGWGRHLVNVWLRGGPRHAAYYGGELVEPGRECLQLLAELEPNFHATPFPFDYGDPDLSAIRSSAGSAIVFTAHSIEQIPQVPSALFDAALSIAPHVTGIHFEPVGWQLPPGRRPDGYTGSSQEHAEYHDYNRNLWQVLTALQDHGRLVIDGVHAEVFSGDRANGTTIIRWHADNPRSPETTE